MKNLVKLIVAGLVMSLALGGVGWAIPQLINYHGKLTNTSGVPVNGGVSMTFTLYDAASGGTILWSETQSVTVANGLYNVQLGNTTVLNPNVFSNPNVYLGVKVGADAEMTPRTQILAVEYAYRAATAEAALTLISTAEINTTGTATFGALTVDTNTLYVDAANNRVGIGTASPVASLEVRGSNSNDQIKTGLKTDTTGNQTYACLWAGTHGAAFEALNPETGSGLHFLIDNSEKMRITNAGQVGIGTTSPARKLSVNGDAGGTSAWNNDSDERLKKNIYTIQNALAKVNQLRGVNFEWKDTNNYSAEKQIGLVAQEVEKVIPEVVDRKGEYYSIAQSSLVADLVEAIKEQQAEITQLKAQTANFQTQLNQLQTMLEPTPKLAAVK